MSIRKLRTVVAVLWLMAIALGQTVFLPWHAAAQGEVGRPPLPPGIVRLPFDGEEEITQVPGCGSHDPNDPNNQNSAEAMALNSRAFDFGLRDEPVLAAGSGTVMRTYADPYGALVLVIDHGQGVRSYYVHLSAYEVPEGTDVRTGDVIATSGSSGLGGEQHLHFAVTINNNDDPFSVGEAANINSLPSIPWENEQLNENGYAICNPMAKDFAVGDAIAEVPTEPVPPDEGSESDSGYDRGAAVHAAHGYLDDAYAFEEDDSAWYVSKVLWAGGLPMTDVWNDDAASGLTDPDMLIPSISGGSGVPAAIPHDLVSYLVDNGFATRTPLDWSNDVPTGADLGDVIAYDYEGDDFIDHVAIVTGFTKDGPTVTEHSPTHQDRYWTYSEEDGAWIEDAFPGSVAYLIHF